MESSGSTTPERNGDQVLRLAALAAAIALCRDHSSRDRHKIPPSLAKKKETAWSIARSMCVGANSLLHAADRLASAPSVCSICRQSDAE